MWTVFHRHEICPIDTCCVQRSSLFFNLIDHCSFSIHSHFAICFLLLKSPPSTSLPVYYPRTTVVLPDYYLATTKLLPKYSYFTLSALVLNPRKSTLHAPLLSTPHRRGALAFCGSKCPSLVSQPPRVHHTQPCASADHVFLNWGLRVAFSLWLSAVRVKSIDCS